MSISLYNEGGFEDRFRVTRTNGKPSPPSARYFVLNYGGDDPHAKVALAAYAQSVREENPVLAEDLFHALEDPTIFPAQHDNAQND